MLDRGEVAELGTHQELLARGGVYAGMWSQQISGENGGGDGKTGYLGAGKEKITYVDVRPRGGGRRGGRRGGGGD